MEGNIFAGNVLHMNEQHKQFSYANNSVLQNAIISKAMVILEDSIKQMFKENVPTCLKLADFGCSTGPNTFQILSRVINTIHGISSQQAGSKPPEVQVFLNDLPGNDFNSIFRSDVPDFIERLKKENGDGDLMGPCFIAAVAGSFYGRLFPSQSLHFIYSCNSIHWLSKVPEGLENNKGNIYIGKSSPLSVLKAYSEQFQKDLFMFLSSRSEEIVAGGRMVLIFWGRENPNPCREVNCFGLLTNAFLDLITEGVVKEIDVDAFNIPVYAAYQGEVLEMIEREGSFAVDKLEVVEVEWDPTPITENQTHGLVLDKQRSGRNYSNTMRAAIEPMVSAHFGEAIVDRLFAKYAIHVAQHLESNQGKVINVVVSMVKK